MTDYAEPTFSINHYDNDGDIIEKGIFLNFDSCSIWIAETLVDFKEFIGDLNKIAKEIEENYYI